VKEWRLLKIIPIGTEVCISLVHQLMDFLWKELPTLQLGPLLDVFEHAV
jgi:hypothetical protein